MCKKTPREVSAKAFFRRETANIFSLWKEPSLHSQNSAGNVKDYCLAEGFKIDFFHAWLECTVIGGQGGHGDFVGLFSSTRMNLAVLLGAQVEPSPLPETSTSLFLFFSSLSSSPPCWASLPPPRWRAGSPPSSPARRAQGRRLGGDSQWQWQWQRYWQLRWQ